MLIVWMYFTFRLDYGFKLGGSNAKSLTHSSTTSKLTITQLPSLLYTLTLKCLGNTEQKVWGEKLMKGIKKCQCCKEQQQEPLWWPLLLKLTINGKIKPCVKLDHKVNKINTLVTMRCATSGQHSSRSSGHLEERGASISPWRVATWTFPRDVTLPVGKKNTAGERCPLMSASVTLHHDGSNRTALRQDIQNAGEVINTARHQHTTLNSHKLLNKSLGVATNSNTKCNQLQLKGPIPS